jgi:ATP-binding cassette subfamily B protein
MPRLGSLGPALRLIREGVDRSVQLNLLGTMLLVTLSGVLAAASPLALKQLVDAVAGSTSMHPTDGGRLLLPGAIYLFVLVGGRLTSDIRPLLASRVEQRVLAVIRQRFFAHLLRLPMAYLVRRRSGELLHSADLAAAGAQAIISHITNSIAPVLIELVLMGVILAQLQQPALLALFIATSLLYLVVFALGVLRQRPAIRAVSAASLDLHAQLSDGISHVETLRCFGAAEQAEQSLARTASHLASRWLRFNQLTVQSALAASGVFALTLTACLTITAEAVAQGQMTVGGFVLASVYMLQMVRPLEMLGAAARDLSRAVGFMQPLLDVLAEPPEATPTTASPSPASWTAPARAPSLRFENLSFGYDPQRPVIRGLDLEIPAGRTTAIVGRSGSGKSSLVRLLLRLYAPQQGRILVDGQAIETLPTADLRALIGLVPQDAGLLQASVSSNIALGLPGATREDIERAAMRAQLHHLVDALPRGYDTLLGERGQTLSGGERQRMAIARALLRRPKIYVLDEPTSMLDTKTEAAILLALREVTAGCTTLIIAHRLSTVMHADEIVVLEGGQVIERGHHAELLAKDRLYAQLWRQQTDG